MKIEILEKYHNDPLFGGHMGTKKLYQKIRIRYYWKNMSKDVAKFIKNCVTCQLSKHRNHVKVPMMITNTPQKAFDVMIIDTIGPLEQSENGNSYAI